MSESKLTVKFPRGGRRAKPSGFSFLTRRCNDEERLRITRYLIGCREMLIHDLGGEENLSAQKLILIDRLISLLGVIRGIEEYHQENIMTDDGGLRPALGKNYLSYVNSTRLILCSLGLERKSEQILSPMQYIREYDKKKKKKSSQKSTKTRGDGNE
jgi:hypothetical protein